jgi:hypothetical protein
MIVLNGEPFVRYNLRSLYPYAHQIIVVEGACAAAADLADPEGHSVDGTLEILRTFQREEDPEAKVIVVTARDEGYEDGFWPEKDEMSQAYAKRASGNYLWQVDSDEFYLDKDMERTLALLREGVDMISFPTLHFWGGLDYVTDGFFLICDGYAQYARLFAWGPGYRYTRHRPPTVEDEKGVDLRLKRWRVGGPMIRSGIRMLHYSFLFPHQVFHKAAYYSTSHPNRLAQRGGVFEGLDTWGSKTYLGLQRPYRVHLRQSHVSWLRRYTDGHPPEVTRMMEDVRSGKLPVELRGTDDIEALLANRWYRLGARWLERFAYFLISPPGRPLRAAHIRARAVLKRLRDGSWRESAARHLGRAPRSG